MREKNKETSQDRSGCLPMTNPVSFPFTTELLANKRDFKIYIAFGAASISLGGSFQALFFLDFRRFTGRLLLVHSRLGSFAKIN